VNLTTGKTFKNYSLAEYPPKKVPLFELSNRAIYSLPVDPMVKWLRRKMTR